MPLQSHHADELEVLARQAACVRLGSRDPHAPHEDLSELRHAMLRLAGRIRADVESEARAEAAPRQRGRFEPGVVTVEGRIVRVELRRGRRG